MSPTEEARIAVVIPCFNDAEFVTGAVESVAEDEPLELVVVDDASSDPATLGVLDALERDGVRVVRHERNRGLAAARMSGAGATSARYVFPLDSDDLARPDALAAMADALDADPGAAGAYGDYLEFGDRELVRAVPERLDPYRLAYTNEYPGLWMVRRSVLEQTGGWSAVGVYEDWDFWMTLAERGYRPRHMGPGWITFRRRVHTGRLGEEIRRRQREAYLELRSRHPKLFGELPEARRASDLSPLRKRLYPLVYGGRRRFGFETRLKGWLDRAGVWTLRR